MAVLSVNNCVMSVAYNKRIFFFNYMDQQRTDRICKVENRLLWGGTGVKQNKQETSVEAWG